MSLRSMTGYGRGEASSGGTRVEFELSAVNRKQLDVQLQLPRGCAAVEERVQALIQGKVSRGRVSAECSLTRVREKAQLGICVDEKLAASYVKEIRKTAANLGLNDNLDASILLSLPQVVRYEEPGLDVEALWPLMERALKRALTQFVQMKQVEGSALQADLEKRLKKLTGYVGRIKAQAPKVARNYREALLRRIGEAGVDALATDERIIKEVALFADRSDITEELTRLDSHLAQVRKKFKSPPPVGKTLDFLAQEMFREINTIGSKANDAKILAEVVEFKAELERIREQVQNIE